MASHQDAQVSGCFRPRRLAHANYFVSDLEQTMDFYKKVAGLEEVYRRAPNNIPDAPAFAGFLSNGNTHHDVAVIAKGQKPGFNHFAYELENESDLLEGYQRATDMGITFRPEDSTIARSIYCQDPDGNGIEIYADITKEWRKIRGDGRTVRYPNPEWKPGDPQLYGESIEQGYYHADPELRRVDDAIFHSKRVTHAAIVAKDYPALYDYYTTIVGLQPALGGPDDPFVVLSGTTGGRHLTLFRGKEGQPTGMHHFGFEVWDEEELEESERKLRQAGIEPAYVLDHATRRSVFLKDPDGFLVEFFVDKVLDNNSLCEVEQELALHLA
jgi:catechol 2,3-dioxygenase